MSQGRDDVGRFTETVTEQDILKVFDYDADPVLSAQEIVEGLRQFGIQITREGVRYRLEQMEDKDLVSRKKLGARAVGWWANVAPELDSSTVDQIESRKESDDWVSL